MRLPSMIRLRIGLITAASLAMAPLWAQQAPAPAAPPAAARPAPIRSPEIHPDHTVTFRLSAPKAAEVTLNGSWDGATNLPMTKDESGVWSTTIGPLAPQLWGYWFIVDGVKALDPGQRRNAARRRALRQPADDLRARVGVLGLQGRPARHGAGVWYPSPTLKMDRRRMMVYTPPDYAPATSGIRSCICCTAAAATKTRG